MKAYVEIVQRREREIDCDVLTHQKVSNLVVYLTESWPENALHSGPVPITLIA